MTKPLREAESHGVRCRWNPVEKDVVTVDRADLIALCDSHDAAATRCAAAEEKHLIERGLRLAVELQRDKYRTERDAARAQVAAMGQVFAFAVSDSKHPTLESRRQLHEAVDRVLAALPTPTPQPESSNDEP